MKKSEIKIDSDIILENLKTGVINLYDLTESLKDYIERELEDGEWVKYNDTEELIWVSCHKKFNKGEDWYLEAPNCLIRFDGYNLNDKEHLEFIEERCMMIYEDKVYEIDSPQN